MPPPQKNGTAAQEPLEHDTTPPLPPNHVKRIQQIVGTITLDLTTLVALSSITSEQTKSTSDTEKRITQLLDYLHTHKDATIQYVASDMVYTLGCIIPL